MTVVPKARIIGTQLSYGSHSLRIDTVELMVRTFARAARPMGR